MVEQLIQVKSKVGSELIIYKGESFMYFDEGLTREVWVNSNKTKVIKFLKDSFHTDFNQEEFNVYMEASEKNKTQMASTVIDNGIIEQEFCNPIKWDDRTLSIKQTLFALSCRREVGWNSKGSLVCFDLQEFKKW